MLALASMHGLPSIKHKVKQEGQTVLEGCGSEDSCLDSLVKVHIVQYTQQQPRLATCCTCCTRNVCTAASPCVRL